MFWRVSLWIYLALIPIILLLGMKWEKRHSWQDNALGLNVSKNVLGLFAVVIVLHHLAQALAEQAGPLSVLENWGVMFVGMFFFFSGYGLYRSYRNKPDYLQNFFKKRYAVILIPFYVCNVIFILTDLASGSHYSIGQALSYLSGWILLNTHMWYVVEIAIFYLLFYLTFRFCKNDKMALTMLTVCIVIFMGISLCLGHGQYWLQGEWWFNSSFLFVIGIYIAKNRDKIISFAKKHYTVLLTVCIAVTVPLYFANSFMLTNFSYWCEFEPSLTLIQIYIVRLLCLSVQLPMIIFFELSVLLIMLKIRFDNPILRFLGKISLELYLIHNIFILYFRNENAIMITNPFLYILAVLFSSIVLAYLLHFIDQKLIGLVGKQSGKRKEADRSYRETKLEV